MTLTPALIPRFIGLSVQGDLGPWTFYTNKNGRIVWYPQAPPLTPPTYAQFYRRNQMLIASYAWRSLPPQQKENWRVACKRCHLETVGFGLFYFWRTKQDSATIQTIERQSGKHLLTKEAKNGL